MPPKNRGNPELKKDKTKWSNHDGTDCTICGYCSDCSLFNYCPYDGQELNGEPEVVHSPPYGDGQESTPLKAPGGHEYE